MRLKVILPLGLLLASACGMITTGVPEKSQTPIVTETRESAQVLTEGFPSITPTSSGSNLSEQGWFSHPSTDPELLGYSYGLLNTDEARIYDDLRDIQTEPDHFRLAPKRPAYLAYDQEQSIDGQEFVHLSDGGWLWKNSLDPVSITQFAGIILTKQPDHPFGWVLKDVNGSNTPSGSQNSGNTYSRYQVVQIRNEQDGFAQLLSGDWLPVTDLAVINPTELTSDQPASCRWVDVNLKTQTLVVYEKCQIIFATLISSALAPAHTPLGSFPVFYKEERLPLFANQQIASREGFYLADVPWLMFFYENWAIHGSYWHDHFGEPWSHGCINVSPYDARWLYQWSRLGDMIVIHE